MMLERADLVALWITFQLALVSTVILLILSIPLAWWLSRTRSRWRVFIEATVSLPLVLPPTVLGFYLLIVLGPSGPVGWLEPLTGVQTLAFSFTGLVIGSVVFSLPFVVQPLRDSFILVSDEVLEAAATLGASPLDRFLTVAVPLARPGFLTATVLGFAHTVGEFGVALIIGGSIPGQTKVVSIAIYDHIEGLAYGRAHALAAVLLIFSFLTLLFVYTINDRFRLRFS